MTRTVLAIDAEAPRETKPLPKPSADIFGFAKPGPGKKHARRSLNVLKLRSNAMARVRMRRFKPPVVIAGEAVADEC